MLAPHPDAQLLEIGTRLRVAMNAEHTMYGEIGDDESLEAQARADEATDTIGALCIEALSIEPKTVDGLRVLALAYIHGEERADGSFPELSEYTDRRAAEIITRWLVKGMAA